MQLPDRSLPLLAPMSEIAGRLAPQVGAYHLMRNEGGRGVLLGGVPGVTNAKVVVLGGGVAGMHAAEIALGMRAEVSILDVSLPTLRRLDVSFHGGVRTLASTAFTIAEEVRAADLVIGSVLIPGAKAPKLVTNDLVAQMRPGSVLVDIAVDQGGCFEDSRPTTHADPTFVVHDSVFYCVANMPGAVPRSSTFALTNATLPYITAVADHGWRDALRGDPALAAGLHTHAGTLANGPVGEAHGIPAVPPPPCSPELCSARCAQFPCRTRSAACQASAASRVISVPVNAFDTGHVALASSAACLNPSASSPSTCPRTVSLIPAIRNPPAGSGASRTAASVTSDFTVPPASVSIADSCML